MTRISLKVTLFIAAFICLQGFVFALPEEILPLWVEVIFLAAALVVWSFFLEKMIAGSLRKNRGDHELTE